MLVNETGVTSPGGGLGGRYGNPGVPSRQDPPLGVAGRVQRKGDQQTIHSALHIKSKQIYCHHKRKRCIKEIDFAKFHKYKPYSENLMERE